MVNIFELVRPFWASLSLGQSPSFRIYSSSNTAQSSLVALHTLLPKSILRFPLLQWSQSCPAPIPPESPSPGPTLGCVLLWAPLYPSPHGSHHMPQVSSPVAVLSLMSLIQLIESPLCCVVTCLTFLPPDPCLLPLNLYLSILSFSSLFFLPFCFHHLLVLFFASCSFLLFFISMGCFSLCLQS